MIVDSNLSDSSFMLSPRIPSSSFDLFSYFTLKLRLDISLEMSARCKIGLVNSPDITNATIIPINDTKVPT